MYFFMSQSCASSPVLLKSLYQDVSAALLDSLLLPNSEFLVSCSLQLRSEHSERTVTEFGCM